MDPITSKASEQTFDFVVGLVQRHVGYLYHYRDNFDELSNYHEELIRCKLRVHNQVKVAERNAEEIEADVQNWLGAVKQKITEIEEFLDKQGHAKTVCSIGFFPKNLWLRYRLGRAAKKMLPQSPDDKLVKSFDSVAHHPEPTAADAAFFDGDYQSFASREETINDIMDQLKGSSVRMIGVHGHGGVGKTTLVKQVAKRARNSGSFNVVIMVKITRNVDLMKIQGEIADMLGLKLQDEASETGRADRLRQRLKKEDNTLVILDDLWDKFDLSKLGIQLDDDDDDFTRMTVKDIPDSGYSMMEKAKSLVDHKRCKILLTSRFRDVLSIQMDVKGQPIFSVGVLSDQDALSLFKKEAKASHISSDLDPQIAKILKKHCAGLPMAIVTVARALRSKHDFEWDEALRKLENQEYTGVQNSMEFSVKISYDHLENEELKSTFLLCARMGHHPLIMDLVKYCIGMGILQRVQTVRDARKRVNTLIQELKDSSLLMDNDSSVNFSMHDTIRDAALSIAYKEQNVFTVRNAQLDDWPDKDELEKCTAISLHNVIIDELPEGLNCPRLTFFQIDTDNPSMKIPDKFFEGMKKLKILILTGFHMPSLPSSIECPTNLRMLCLERCRIGGRLSIIEKLNKLRILTLSGSNIECLPCDFGQLSKLQLFDISNCSKPPVILPNVISRLTNLEELYLRNILIQWEVEGKTNQSQETILAELRHLHQLTSLDICIPSAAVLPRDLFFDKLDRYKIVIGDPKMLSMGNFKMPKKYEKSRTLALQLQEGTDIHSQEGIKMLFKGVENLLLGELNGVRNVFYELNLDGFPNVKHLSIINNDIEYIINSMESMHPQKVFPRLESLCLYNLVNIKKICFSQLTNDSFNNLKIIKLQICGKLQNLFSVDMVTLLGNLETIEVSECESLEEIVVRESQENTANNMKDLKIEFPQLRFLTLQSLQAFVGFYTDGKMLSRSHLQRQVSNGALNEITVEHELGGIVSHYLFNEQVQIPNLESLDISSINIPCIWKEQPSMSFQNLIKLNVEDCNNLTKLLSLSMGGCLKNLKSLAVSRCKKMEEIFYSKEFNMDETKQIDVFPKLEEIQFSHLEGLKRIWHTQVGSNSFGSLNSVVIKDCEELVTVFPHHMVGKFQKLVSLKVFNCKSVIQIFDLEGTEPTDCGNETSLQFIYIKALQNLRHIWNRDPDGILNFKILQTVEVYGCPNLQNLFPVSVVKGLQNLRYLSVLYCTGMKEIVASEKESKTSNMQLAFPQLNFVQFQQLPKLESFYGGRHTLDWPELKRLSVCFCDKLEAFTIETSQTTKTEVQPIFLDEKVIRSLEMMTVTLKEANWLQQCIGNYRMNNLKDLRLASLPSTDILYWLLHRIPNLEDLMLYNCQIKELLPREKHAAKMGSVVQLKGLALLNMQSLHNIGFERDPVLQRVERLRLHICPLLTNLVPPSVSFTYLTHLEVSECEELINLMSFPTAKSLVQLTTMKITECKALKEIVANWGTEKEKAEEIIFRKLMTLELVSLENLMSFCSIVKCTLKFPSLEHLIVQECPMMKVFSEGDTITPKLRQVHTVEGEDEEKWYPNDDLNATIQKIFTDMFASVVSHLKLRDQPKLIEIWHDEVAVPDRCFSNLKSLVVDGCESISNAIPFHLLPFLGNLEELEVRNCISVKAIFDMKDITEDRKNKNIGPALPFRIHLKKVILSQLPNLERVWNKNPQGIVTLHVLQEVYVEGCKWLRSLFPASVAKDLVKLERLTVKHCGEMVDIVAKDEMAIDGATVESMFPCMNSLTLWELPKLKYLYAEVQKVEWPALKSLDVYHCSMLEMLTLQSESNRNGNPEDQAFVLIEKVLPNLEQLSLSKEDTMMILNGQFQANLLCKLESIVLKCFHNKSDIIPYGLFQQVPTVKAVEVRCCYFKKIFLSGRPDMDYTGVLLHLKQLRLKLLPWLNSIGLEQPWVDPITNGLEILEVDGCPHLMNLVPSTVSFSNLRELTVSKCLGLIYLFTSSTAKSLDLLGKMSISECQSIQQIVSKEEDESVIDDIKFASLKTLFLNSLPSLGSFYTGSSALSFPSLEQISVFECPKMSIFCQGYVIARNLKKVEFEKHIISEPMLIGDEFQGHRHGERWLDDDLNITMKSAFEKMAAEFQSRVKHLKLGDHPELKVIWHGLDRIPDACFTNLKSLIVDGCEFMSDIIIPYKLLLFLCNLEELKVQNCNSVKVIFDMKGITEDTKNINIGPARHFSFRLKKLTLIQLPILEHVWNKDPQGIVSLQNLQEVYVERCKCLERLFPASVAKDLLELENLTVKYCEKMVEIVAKDGTGAEDATKEFVFPCVTSLTLWELPNLKCFYPGIHKLEWPVLKNLGVYHCRMLQTLTMESNSDGERNLEDLALVSSEKVVPNLEQLSVGNEDTAIILDGKFWTNLRGQLKSVILQCFHDELDIFPYEFLQVLPNTERLQVSCSCFGEIFSSETLGEHCSYMEKIFYYGMEDTGELSVSPLKKFMMYFSPDLNPLELEHYLVDLNPDLDYTGFLSNLKHLKLEFLSKLKSIGLEHSWVHPITNDLETLEVEKCPSLINLVPLPVSFSKLRELTVSKCHGLVHLFTSSTAASLDMLENMFISECESIQQIVSKEGDESVHLQEIVFGKLRALFLNSLPSLGSFYTDNCALRFPSLEHVSVFECPKMTTFCQGVVTTSKLLGVEFQRQTSTPMSLFEDEFQGHIDGVRWDGDLNITIRKAFTDLVAEFACDVEHLELSDYPELEDIWLGVVPVPVPDRCFSNLKSLVVQGCEFLSNVVPTYLLPFLSNLEVLKVRSCHSLKAIFGSEDMGDRMLSAMEPASNLRELQVIECHGLVYIFTSCTAKRLVCLEKITIEKCESIGEIMAKEEEDESSQDEIVFLQLKVLSISSLSSLKGFYPGKSTLLFPSLEHAIIVQCLKMDFFSRGVVSAPHLMSVQTSSDWCWEGDLNSTIKTLFQEKVANTGHFTLVDDPERLEIWLRLRPVEDEFFSHLKSLVVNGCKFSSDVIPSNLLPLLRNLAELKVVSCDSVEAIFGVKDIKKYGISFPLKKLTLEQLPNLKHVWNEDPQGTTRFQDLQEVHVDKCDCLEYLFPATVAKGLVKLEELDVRYCEELVEIVKQDETPAEGATEEFVLPRVVSVILWELPNLKYFYPGLDKQQVHLPLLKELDVHKCPDLNPFTSEFTKLANLTDPFLV